MARLARQLKPDCCYHITTRCNNREFRLTRLDCREVLLYTLEKCRAKYGFKLYALCIIGWVVATLREGKPTTALSQREVLAPAPELCRRAASGRPWHRLLSFVEGQPMSKARSEE
jgi:hypothetical protein